MEHCCTDATSRHVIPFVGVVDEPGELVAQVFDEAANHLTEEA